MVTHMPTPAVKLAEGPGEDEIALWAVRAPRGSGRAPLRAVLARCLGTAPDAVPLQEEPHGRPQLAWAGTRLAFNWSHSGEQALVAVARGVQPGVDIEMLERRQGRDVLALAQRFFAADETHWLAGVAEGEARRHAFLRLWTAKEALLKAHGRGLAFGLERVAVTAGEGGLHLQRFDGEALADWRLVELDAGAGLVAALAWRGEPRRVVWRHRMDAPFMPA